MKGVVQTGERKPHPPTHIFSQFQTHIYRFLANIFHNHHNFNIFFRSFAYLSQFLAIYDNLEDSWKFSDDLAWNLYKPMCTYRGRYPFLQDLLWKSSHPHSPHIPLWPMERELPPLKQRVPETAFHFTNSTSRCIVGSSVAYFTFKIS